jgi:predicted dehydrogenase
MLEQRGQRRDKFNTLIIGAGRIASGFDNFGGENILTHAHAYKVCKKTKLLGFYDINSDQSKIAANKWSCQSFGSLGDVFKREDVDIVSVCTPTDTHFEVLRYLLDKRPKIVICEKPLTLSKKQGEEIIELYQEAKIPILVNYSRRFDSAMLGLQDVISKKKYGNTICASALYTKGLLNNGSHLINLLQFFFGDYTDGKRLYSVFDYTSIDPTVAAIIGFVGCKKVHLIPGNEENYSIFELDILFEEARVRLTNFGFSVCIQKKIADPIFPNYSVLGEEEIRKTSYGKSCLYLVENAVGYLEKGDKLLCTGSDALRTQVICESLI